MVFGNPNVIYLFPVLIGLFVFYFFFQKRRRKALQAFAQKELLPKLVSPNEPRKRKRKTMILLMAMAFGLAALLRPQWELYPEEGERGGLDILVAVDVSRSMLAEDVKPNRLERAKGHVRGLVKRLRGDRIGLIAFSGTAVLLCPLTMDYDAFMHVVSHLDVETISRGGTSISAAIRIGMKSYQEEKEMRNRVFLLITDGDDHGEDSVSVAQAAGKQGIKIVSVGIGTKEGDLIPVLKENGGKDFLKDIHGNVVYSRLNEPLLREIALNGNGAYFTPGEIEAGFDRIYRNELILEQKTVGKRSGERRYGEWFQIPLAIALLLLFLESLTSFSLPFPRLCGERSMLLCSGVLLMILPVLLAACEWNRFREAQARYHEGRYEEALEAYRRSLAENPDSEILNFNTGAVLYQVGDYEKAKECFSKVLATGNPDLKAKSSYNLGNCKFRLGEQKEKVDLVRSIEWYKEARNDYRKAIEWDDKDEDGRYNLNRVEQKISALSAVLRSRNLEKEGRAENAGIDSFARPSGHQTRLEGTGESKGMKTEAAELSKKEAELLLEQYGWEEELRIRGGIRKPKGEPITTDKDW